MELLPGRSRWWDDRVSAALNYGAGELANRMTTVTSPTMTETGQPRNGTGRCFVISDLAAVVIDPLLFGEYNKQTVPVVKSSDPTKRLKMADCTFLLSVGLKTSAKTNRLFFFHQIYTKPICLWFRVFIRTTSYLGKIQTTTLILANSLYIFRKCCQTHLYIKHLDVGHFWVCNAEIGVWGENYHFITNI